MSGPAAPEHVTPATWRAPAYGAARAASIRPRSALRSWVVAPPAETFRLFRYEDLTGERQVDEVASGDDEVKAYIATLEEREPAVDLPEASGEAIAREFERYLKRRNHRDE